MEMRKPKTYLPKKTLKGAVRELAKKIDEELLSEFRKRFELINVVE